MRLFISYKMETTNMTLSTPAAATQQITNSLPSSFLENKRIKYLQNFSTKRSEYKEIDYKDITADLIKRGFNELLTASDKYVRLYFDIDHLTTTDQFNSLITDFIEPLSQHLNSQYSIGGYSKDKEIAKATGLEYIKKAEKVISLHIILYQICFDRVELSYFVNNYQVNEYVDPLVYKVEEQLMRHVLSDKFTSFSTKKPTAGAIIKGGILDQLITPNGTETILPISKLTELYEPKPTITKPTITKPTEQPTEQITRHFINLSNEQIIKILIDNIDPDFANSKHVLSLLCHSPLTVEDITAITAAWQASREHKTAFNYIDYIQKYYEFEDSDKWIYSLLKLIDEDKREQIIKDNKIYKLVNINNGIITMDKIIRRKYKDMKSLLYDLRHCVGIVDNRIYIKKTYRQRNGTSKTKLTALTHEEFNNTYNMVHPFRSLKASDITEEQNEADIEKLKKMTLKDVINIKADNFIYNNIKKSKDDIPDVINEFMSLPYKAIKGDDLITPFLQHIKAVICENDADKFDYIIKWFANIIQNIYVKNGTMLIFYGSKGCGKSIFTDVMAELLGDLATPSVCDMGKIFGKFNDFLTNKVYININEAPDYDKKKAMTQTIKETITSTYLAVESKGKSVKDGEQFANFTITTNFDDPVEVEIGDRRLAFFHCSNYYVGNSEYFDNLMKNIKGRYNNNYNADFMGQLYNYFLNIDISKFNAADYVIKLNSNYKDVNNENLERQYYNSNDLIRFMCDNVESFTKGITIDEILRNLPNYSKNGIGKKLKNYCDFRAITEKDYNAIYNIEADYAKTTKQQYYFFKEHPDDIENLLKWKANTMDIVYDYSIIKSNYKRIDEYYEQQKAEKQQQKAEKEQQKQQQKQQQKAEKEQQKQQQKAEKQQQKADELEAKRQAKIKEIIEELEIFDGPIKFDIKEFSHDDRFKEMITEKFIINKTKNGTYFSLKQ